MTLPVDAQLPVCLFRMLSGARTLGFGGRRSDRARLRLARVSGCPLNLDLAHNPAAVDTLRLFYSPIEGYSDRTGSLNEPRTYSRAD